MTGLRMDVPTLVRRGGRCVRSHQRRQGNTGASEEVGIVTCEFFAAGIPTAQGSARAIINRNTGRAVLIQSSRSKLHLWRDQIRNAAGQAGVEYQEAGPIGIELEFRMPRPRMVPKERCGQPTVAPDVDKQIRAALDALTGVAYKDDAQVVQVTASKRYCGKGEPPGVMVRLSAPVGTLL